MKERMTWLSSSQNSVYFGFTPLSLSAMNSHSASHVHHTEEDTCSSGYDIHSLFQTPPLLSSRCNISVGDTTAFTQLANLCFPFTC